MPPESSSQPKQFQCKTCCKSYKKKDSLTRHSHNHQDNQQHVCLECSRNFHRRDILQRHLDLHHTGRTRGVRACERCRVSKVRCDSKTPCARCVKACQICIYSGTGKDGSSTKTISVSEPTLPELLTQHQQSANGSHNRGTPPDFDASPSKSPQTATNMAQVSIVDEFTTSGPTKHNSCNEGRNTMFSDQRHTDESDTADITMTNTVNPLIWGQEGFLAWPSADLFLNDNFIADMDLYANNSILLNGVDNAIFEFDDNSTGIAQPSKDPVLLLSDLPPDGDGSLTFATDFSNFNIGSTGYTPISSLDRSRVGSGDSENLRYSSQTTAENGPRGQATDVPGANYTLQDIVKEMVEFAIQNITASGPLTPHKEWSREFSSRIQRSMPEAESILSQSSCPHLLHHFCGQFMAHFNPLWPLIRPKGFDMDSTLPALYLTIASIGAMYSGARCSQLGLMIHENLRMAVLTTPLLHQQSRYSLECLQSLLLTEISTLYFGPRSALPIAQRIGAMIVLQARTMGIFSGRAFSKYNSVAPTLEQWSHHEGTIRVAFGSFRAESFVSALLNSPLLVSAEEINLDLPCPDKLWMGSIEEQRASLKARGHTTLIYSDLVRIAMDRSEVMPDLEVSHRELVLYGAQESIWRFSHDPELFSRTMGQLNAEHISVLDDNPDGELFTRSPRRQPRHGVVEDWKSVSTSVSPVEVPTHDHLDCFPRKMTDLRLDYNRMMLFLRDWKSSFVGNQSRSQLEGSRFNLLNSRLLYHLGFLRLRADLHTLDLLTIEYGDFPKDEKEDALDRVWQWSKTMSAERALQHACAIWVLVSSESTWRGGSRARFNILCLIALHCASKVVWAYAGAHTDAQRGMLKMPAASTEFLGPDIVIFRENSQILMECFHRLFHVITRGWVSWFPETVMHMAKSPLPLLHGSEVGSVQNTE